MKKAKITKAQEYHKLEELTGWSLTAGQLKKALEKIDDDVLICSHRVEDLYFKSHGWKVFKALWEKVQLDPEHLQKMEKNLENEEDPSLVELVKYENNYGEMKTYIDVIPGFQGFMTITKNGEKVFVISPHY